MNQLNIQPQKLNVSKVFSHERDRHIKVAAINEQNYAFKLNARNGMDGLSLMQLLDQERITACFFDPQYRGIMDKMSYGNEGKRQKGRAALQQMNNEDIHNFLREIDRILIKSGHLFFWVDKFHLCEGIHHWIADTNLAIVDLITWDKGAIGMGYRSRRKSEYCIVLQKKPIRAKGVWVRHDIPDVWTEKIKNKQHPHQKPIELQKSLIEAVSDKHDLILDPCAGSYTILAACKATARNFIGTDIENRHDGTHQRKQREKGGQRL